MTIVGHTTAMLIGIIVLGGFAAIVSLIVSYGGQTVMFGLLGLVACYCIGRAVMTFKGWDE